MALAVLIVEAVVFSYIERKYYGTRYTPIAVLTFPVIGLAILNLIWGKDYGFFPLYLPSLWYWVWGVLCFWVAGNYIASFIIGKVNIKKERIVINDLDNRNVRFFFTFFSLFMLAIIYLKISQTNFLEFEGVDDKDRREFGLGIAAHASLLIRIPVIYFISTIKFKRKDFIGALIVLLWLGYSIFYNKSNVVIPFLAGILGRFIINKGKLNILILAALIGFAIFLFWGHYSLMFGYSAPRWFIVRHFLFYVNAGFLSFSEYVKHDMVMGVDWQLLYQPVFNLFNKILGREVETVVSEINVPIDNQYTIGSNVKTFFGSIFIYGGYIVGTLTCIIWGVFSYLFLALTIVLRQIFYFLIYLLILSSLFFGWFDIYFNTLIFYEIVIFWTIVIIANSYYFRKGKLSIYGIFKAIK